jgi:hypothetical protein
MAHSLGESAERHVRSRGMSMGLQIALCQLGWTSLFCGVTGAWDIIHEIPSAISVALLHIWLQYNAVRSGQFLTCRVVVWCGFHGAGAVEIECMYIVRQKRSDVDLKTPHLPAQHCSELETWTTCRRDHRR